MSLFIAQTEPSAVPDSGFSQMLILFAIAMLFFYFILWRPEQKRRKQLEEIRSALKKGDQVNAMGIIGTVNQIKDKTVILNMVDGATKIEVVKAAITEVTPSEVPSSKEQESK